MAIREFALGPLRGLRHAAAEGMGNLVVLSGPNGAGKSTLLELLRQNRHAIAEPGTNVMFVGPHRTWRSSALNQISLLEFPMESYGALLASDTLPFFQYGVPQGMQGLQGAPRDSSSAEDTPAFVKTSLAKLRGKQQDLLAAVWKRNSGKVEPGEVPDLFEPFRKMIATLLPHLSFVGIDTSDTSNIRVNFQDIGGGEPVFDIDQLSSGEKAAISLLLPLIERQAEQLAGSSHAGAAVVSLTMLLDEPEIHLHPLLQLQMLQYFRLLAASNEAQFIITTHSPTLLDALSDDELYLLSPAAISPNNQLSRLTNAHERLEVARDITGATHLLTRSKPIVFIEGEAERSGISSDTRLVTNLLDRTRSWALIPGRSKKEVISAVDRLRGAGLDLPGTPVFGIVDSDTDSKPSSPFVVAWPVAMIENFLLEPTAIHDTLRPFGAQTSVGSTSEIEALLNRVAADLRGEEIRLRIQRQLPIGRISARPDQLDKVGEIAEESSAHWLEALGKLDVSRLGEAAESEVDEILAGSQQLERFHGKKILRQVHQELGVQNAGIAHAAFALMLSTHPLVVERAARLASPALRQIALYFPAELQVKLRVIGSPEALTLASRCEMAEDAWLDGAPRAEGRQELRSEIFAFARLLPEAEKQELVRLAAQIGTDT